MNAVEIEEAVSQLAEAPFDPEEFPFAFLEAFGNKATTIKKLKSKKGGSNHSDLGGVLQRNNIHLKVCPAGQVTATLTALRESLATTRYRAKFILVTDGEDFQAENLAEGETLACDYPDFHNYFGFFLPLAGITTVKQIRENAFDIKATGRLNRLYVELLKTNPGWDAAERRQQMNHFMAQLIFCFFAEDTNIFQGEGLFTQTVMQMSAGDGANTHEVLSEIFRAMATPLKQRAAAGIRNWANPFPYANGDLFGQDSPHPLAPSPKLGEGGQRAGGEGVPRFSKIARSYLLHVGNLDWKQINPDIFGSMIQAVADDDERGALGMHYTSVPNILKVLNPLFLEDLRSQLEEAGDNPRKLLNLRKRLAHLRVFDPACGSGNFLVIAYKQMREIEAEVNRRRGEADRPSDIPLSNFRGIEIRHFAVEIARLALVIAQYQCDVIYLGQRKAQDIFLPLKKDNWITCGNALRLDWLSLCPPRGTGVKVQQQESLDLWGETQTEAEVDFENEGGETYICGNPPYLGSTWQSKEQKADLKLVFDGRTKTWKSLDYVAGWFMKAADYGTLTRSVAAFVATNSICQGQQVPILWPLIFATGHEIVFAHTSFKWANLASHNAGVTVAIVGISNQVGKVRRLFSEEDNRETVAKQTENINAYLVSGPNVIVEKVSKPRSSLFPMNFGNKPVDGGNLLLSGNEVNDLGLTREQHEKFIRRIYGSAEFIRGLSLYCLWIEDEDLDEVLTIEPIRQRIEGVRVMRLASRDQSANEMATRAHQMREMNIGSIQTISMPCVSSESRDYLPVGLIDNHSTVTNLAFALYDAPLWNMALIASRLHLVWIATVCGKLETRYRYSNTLGWNTFPVPTLTQQNKADLTRCAEDILLAREHYFPATIADMYDPDRMDREFPLVREAHDRNDETLERIYIGRRFKNDTERLEKLFELYTKMISQQTSSKKPAPRKSKG